MKKSNLSFLTGLIFLFLSLCIAVVTASAEPQSITIVRGQNFPPYHYLDQNKKEKGFIIEIIKETAAIIDINVKFKQFPWSRCLKMVKTGEADAMMNLFKTQKRETFMHFHENIIAHETNVFFTLTNKSIEYNGQLKNIQAYKLGAIRNYSYGTFFDDFVFPNKFQLETEKELINSLIYKRSDIIIGNQMTILMLLDQMEQAKIIKPLDPAVSTAPLYLGFSKARGHAQLSEQFSKTLNRFKQSKKYNSIMNTYLPTSQ